MGGGGLYPVRGEGGGVQPVFFSFSCFQLDGPITGGVGWLITGIKMSLPVQHFCQDLGEIAEISARLPRSRRDD